jgi:hypothetical protein
MKTEHTTRSSLLRGSGVFPAPERTAPRSPLSSFGTAPRSPLLVLIAQGQATAVRAQIPTNLPPPSQAASALQQAVQQNPGIADLIRQKIAQSGLTPDQVRARLQASGYPPTLLDAYLGAQTPGQAAPVLG